MKLTVVFYYTFAFGVGLISFSEGYKMNMTKYFKMPNMYNFDDYDRCFQEFRNLSTYCFVRAEVLPKNFSEIWETIAEVSQHENHHFDHRHLYFGVCLHRCEQNLKEFDETDSNMLYAGILNNNTKVNTYLNLFTSEVSNRKRYNRLTNQCVNLYLKEKYDLLAESVVEYCNTNRDVIAQDTWNMTVYSIICVLIILATLSSLYDLYMIRTQENKTFTYKDHYKSTLTKTNERIFVLFSVPRNWYRLNQEPSGKSGRDLRFLDCLKFFSMFLVIFAHTTWVMFEGAISNPQDPERMLHTVAGTLLMGGNLITITFLVISGFLLTLTWIEVEKTKDQFKLMEYIIIFVKFNVFRYMRLTLPYGIIILLSGLYFENSGGPLWRHIIEREQLSCRKNWWTNLLYINNYVNNNERCMLQSWYLAADTHSFILSLVLLMTAKRYPKIRNKLFGFVFAFFYILPGVMTFLKQYSPVMIASPQTQRDSFINDRNFTEFYAPFQMNFGSYFSGVLTALVYHHISSNQIKLKNYKVFHVVWYALFPLGVVWILSAHPFVQNQFNEPSLFWGCVYAAMQRTSWAIGLGVFIIGMSEKVGWIFRKFSCLPIFRILGRLTYGTFVVHLLVVRIALATLRQPIFFNTNILFAFVLFTVVVSYLFSFVLTILVELPVSAFLKLLR